MRKMTDLKPVIAHRRAAEFGKELQLKPSRRCACGKKMSRLNRHRHRHQCRAKAAGERFRRIHE